MSVRNVGGHGVSSMAGHHNQQAMNANIQFPRGGGMTDSMAGRPSESVGPYKAPTSAKKKFPPAR